MKHLNKFFDFFKRKSVLDEENLYTELNTAQIYDFYENHKSIKIDEKIYDDINDFINQNDSIKYLSKVELNYSMIIQHRESDGVTPKYAWIQIRQYDDEWFIINIISGKTSSNWTFKCDTLEGVKQVLLRYPDYKNN